MKNYVINVVIAVIAIFAGIIGVGIQASEHNHEVMVAKAVTHANNMMAWEEFKMGRDARLWRLVNAYVYEGEEDAPELVEANYWINQMVNADKKIHSLSDEEYVKMSSSLSAEKDRAGWNVGRCLVAWSERTGRCAVSYGEGYCYRYFTRYEDGTEREKDIYFSNGEEVNNYLASVRKAFPGI